MISRRIMILSSVAVVGSVYFIFLRDRDDFIFLFAAGLIVLMITYVFQFQIDQLMTRGVPQKISEAMRQMLELTAPHFAVMSPVAKKLIEDRMQRWMAKKDFIQKNEQEAPEDVKYILAYYSILMTMHQELYLYDGIDRIVFYHHPFLSPAHPDDVHIVEVEPKDGTIIISVPDLLKGHLEKGYYNLSLHTAAESYRLLYMKQPIQWPPDIWDQLERISSINRNKLEDYLGLPILDPWPVAVHHQITYRDAHISEVLAILPQFRTLDA